MSETHQITEGLRVTRRKFEFMGADMHEAVLEAIIVDDNYMAIAVFTSPLVELIDTFIEVMTSKTLPVH